MKMILKVLVGSKAHGVANEASDDDFRGVFVEPTESFLTLNSKPKETFWQEGDQDNTFFEIKKFLNDAILGLPNTIEVFFAPILEVTPEGKELLDLFPCIWDKQKVYDSFVNYAENNIKKMLENKDGREKKYAGFALRTINNLYSLIFYNKINMIDCNSTSYLKSFKNPNYILDKGHIVNLVDAVKNDCKANLKNCNQKPKLWEVEGFLLKVRRHNYGF